MKKLMTFVLAFVCLLCLFGCGNQPPERRNTFQSDFITYYELSDGTWECDGHIYKHRLEIEGTMPGTAVSSTFVYLCNIETISFEQAFLAAGISSNTEDYFSLEEAVLVDYVTG